MAIDFGTYYRPPGVYTQDDGGPQLAVRSSVPTAVAIFGLSVGYLTQRESLRINPDETNEDGDLVPVDNAPLSRVGAKVIDSTPVVFASVNVNLAAPGTTIEGTLPDGTTDEVSPSSNDLVYLTAQTKPTENGLYRFNTGTTRLVRVVDSFRVVNPLTGYTYVNGLDYTIELVDADADNDDADASAAVQARNNVYTIKRINRGAEVGIQEGDVVSITYRYTDPNYFDVYALYDYDDVRDRYGDPFDADGQIQSEVTLAAKMAFTNGASVVLTCAVDPADPDNPTIGDYQDALEKFRNEEQIAIIVPGTGDPDIFPLVSLHVSQESEKKFERRAVVGVDGSSTIVATSPRIELAQSLSNQRVAMVSPSRFNYFSPELNRTIQLGGQYMAAAVAGKSASLAPAMPLTRKTIAGFNGPAENLREGEKDLESQNGLMVVERTRRNQVQIRHGVTTNSNDLLTREWSIIGQQDVMVYRIRDYLDNDGLIGMPIYDTTLIQVKASAESALVSLVRDGVIVGYQNLKVRQIATQPDVIEVRYEWRPAYPLNYILVRYSVAVETGDVVITNA
jgi:hypothetical protein